MEIWCLVAVEEKLYKLGGGRGASSYVNEDFHRIFS